MSKTIFSGIQPSGSLHLGNYIGAISQWKEMQEESDCIFCIVDMHAITVPQDPNVLRENIRKTAALFVAAGINPGKSHIFIQSENPDHANLAWILNCVTPFGQLERMTQFKDKSAKQAEGTTAGLFVYPTLMAADILLYKTNEVPVGEDQKQHIELTRDVAEKFNSRFGQIFTLPDARIPKETAKIMSLSDPTSKMSKSDRDPNGVISLLDEPDIIRKKIKGAVTDSGSEIKKTEERSAISNLLTIFEIVSGKSINQLETDYKDSGYGKFKDDLAETIIEFVKPIQDTYQDIVNDSPKLDSILDQGRDYVISKSSPTLKQVYQAVGLGR